ncbi:MAG: DUF1289 domain-containing protein [Pseudomonadota bacterium]
MSKKVPSPCIDVCKFRRGGHCIGCSMDKKQKKKFKKIDKRKKQLDFIVDLMDQQKSMGGYAFWEKAYRKRCRKKDVDCPLDDLETT